MSGLPQTGLLPPTVTADLPEGRLLEYWHARLAQHTQDSYAGVPLSKFPEDLRVYEHLVWMQRPDTVIELGTYQGASALWFRDRMRTLRDYGRIERAPKVISVDVDHSAARPALAEADPSYADEITLVEADITDPGLPDRIEGLVPRAANCLVIEDSAHVFETTAAALRGFARFVPPGGFFVVEDGCVDMEALRPSPDWPRGVLPALDAWLATSEGGEFAQRRDLELYGITCHPRGFLQRRER
jgi:cephalosporin hydroxylase